MAADWTTIKVEYVNSSISLRDLAAKHGIKAPGLMKRCATEGWEAERKQTASKVSKQATESLIESKAVQLAKFNEDDLKMAKNLRAMVNKQIQNSKGDMEPAQIRALAGAASEAQRIGRLALGAETESSVVMTKELPSSIEDFV
jgi:hypothetical protein